MAKVSKRPLGRAFKKELVDNFLAALNVMDNKERTFFLDQVITPSEKLMLGKRLGILMELGKGRQYEEIADKYKVISNTISRMSNVLRRSFGDMLPILSKVEKVRHRRRQRSRKNSRKSTRRSYGSRTLAGTKRLLGL